jgi:phospholipid/cholesterol/gamma-HCH transport system ATP-binding protein
MIRFTQVNKSFGARRVLQDLDLEIRKGELTFIIGKSGEGKSVTIKHMMGLLQPDSGHVYVEDADITKLDPTSLQQVRKKFGILFQHAALFDSMTVEENIQFPLREHTQFTEAQINHRVAEVLQQVDLPHAKQKYPEALSTGEKKRVGLARALAAKPKILLYDEPTTGMDPLISEMIDALIVKVNQEEKEITSIVISHDLKAALATADRIIMLYQGRVELSGPPCVFRNAASPVVRQFFSGKVDGPMEFL